MKYVSSNLDIDGAWTLLASCIVGVLMSVHTQISWSGATRIFVPPGSTEPLYVHGPLMEGAVATAMSPLVEKRQ